MDKVPWDKLAAIVLIIGCVILLIFRIDGEVKSILIMAAVYLFAPPIAQKIAQRKTNNQT